LRKGVKLRKESGADFVSTTAIAKSRPRWIVLGAKTPLQDA